MLNLVKAETPDRLGLEISKNDMKTGVSELALAWQVLEDLMRVYTSGEMDAINPSSSSVVRARDPEAEADRVLEEQLAVFQKVIETPSVSANDMITKLRIWKETVGADGSGVFLQPADELVLSVLADLETLVQRPDQDTESDAG